MPTGTGSETLQARSGPAGGSRRPPWAGRTDTTETGKCYKLELSLEGGAGFPVHCRLPYCCHGVHSGREHFGGWLCGQEWGYVEQIREAGAVKGNAGRPTRGLIPRDSAIEVTSWKCHARLDWLP